jgi:beta-lactamase regulating signal transducer with metallopeptidase domain
MSALLIALFVKSGLIAGTGLVLSTWVARRPVDRSDVLRATVVLLLLLPLAVAFGPELRLALLPAAEPVAVAPTTLWSGTVRPAEGLTVSGSVFAPTWAEIMAVFWSVGAVVVAGRFALGVLTLSRWTAAARPVEAPAWREAVLRHRMRKRPSLRASEQATSPLSWGLPPGVVLLDKKTLGEPQTAPAVIAHEMAHITRGDWIFLVLSRLALALFWFNPLVWIVHRQLIERSEEAADAIALGQVDRQTYARALVGLAARTAPVPLGAAAMAAPGPALKQRIARIMTDTPSRRRPAVVIAAVAALAAVATPIAALEITRALQVQAEGVPPTPPTAPTAPTPPSPPMQTLAAPPAPPAPADWAEAPEPPAPPAPPSPPEDGRGVWFYRGSDEGAAEARVAAAHARERAAHARLMALQSRADGEWSREQADAVRAAADAARQAGEHARRAGEEARAHAEVAMREARTAMANARVQMRQGADEMRRGAENMREEGRRLADPAYRAEQIERNRARGHTITDAELQALGPRLIRQADDLERQADQLAAQSADAG